MVAVLEYFITYVAAILEKLLTVLLEHLYLFMKLSNMYWQISPQNATWILHIPIMLELCRHNHHIPITCLVSSWATQMSYEWAGIYNFTIAITQLASVELPLSAISACMVVHHGENTVEPVNQDTWK